MRAVAAVIGLLALNQASEAQITKTESAQRAIDMVRQLCLSPEQYRIETGIGGDVTFRNLSAKVATALKFNKSDIPGYIDGISGVIAAEMNNKIRDCQIINFPKILSSLLDRPNDGKIVILMDSPLNVYRTRLRDVGGTNADDITSALAIARIGPERNQRIVTIKETTGVEWDRSEQLISLKPDGVVIHYSAFEAADVMCSPSNDKKFRDCNDRFFETVRLLIRNKTPVVIYSRTKDLCRMHRAFFQGKIAEARSSSGGGRVALLEMSGEDFTRSGAREAVRETVEKIVGQTSSASTGNRHCFI